MGQAFLTGGDGLDLGAAILDHCCRSRQHRKGSTRRAQPLQEPSLR